MTPRLQSIAFAKSFCIHTKRTVLWINYAKDSRRREKQCLQVNRTLRKKLQINREEWEHCNGSNPINLNYLKLCYPTGSYPGHSHTLALFRGGRWWKQDSAQRPQVWREGILRERLSCFRYHTRQSSGVAPACTQESLLTVLGGSVGAGIEPGSPHTSALPAQFSIHGLALCD